MDACIEGVFQLLVSPEILEEYRRVGEEFSGRQPNVDFERLLGLLVAQGAVVMPRTLPGVCRDPDDDKFIACAIAGGAAVIVSGDKDLLAIPGDIGVEVLTPREFLNRYIQPI